eukprot:TRINITY_DN2863_c0_g2_i1.p1 TRINITY_DN2863_c0_g2~~TRINITY_DN2863_c0_g2_i1.p1  ORF type:complete len:353 (-),score=48.61 TRINITY_DN2863_c0_g2_i1:62-1120(-)
MLFQMKTVLNSKIKTTIEGLESGEKKPFETHRAQVTKLADSLKRIDESISKKLCEEPSSSRREDTSIYNGLPTFELSTAAFRLNAGELFGNVITPITERARRDKSLLCSSLHSRDLSPIQRDPEYPKPAPVEILPPRNEVPRTKGNSRSLFEMFDECLNSIETRKKAEPISIPSSEPARRLLKNVMLTYQRKVNEIRRFYFKLWKHAKSNDMPNACPDDIDLLKESLTFELENPPPRTRSGSQDNHIPVESPAPVKNTQKKRPTSQNNRSGVSLQRTNKQKEIKVEKGAEVKKERDRSSNKENEGLKVRNLVPKQPPKRLEEDPPQSREKQGPSIVGKKISHVVSFLSLIHI